VTENINAYKILIRKNLIRKIILEGEDIRDEDNIKIGLIE
jgi:hypothetical protein